MNFTLNKYPISIFLRGLIVAVVVFVSPGMMLGEEPESIVDRLAYNAEFDPTTAFLMNGDGDNEQLVDDIISFSKGFLGCPYRRGSKGPKAFDCSGFTSYVFGQFGIKLSPSSTTQYTQGVEVDKQDAQPGDLVFFGGRRGGNTRVGHVGMVVDVDDRGRMTFIHAAVSGGIRYDVYPDGGYYSSRFIGVKRVIE